KSIKTGLSAGRVQTVALRLICEGEAEIRKFVPQEYWTIEADLEKDSQEFQARLHKLDGKKPEIKDEATARAIVADALKIPFTVTAVETGERRRASPPPSRTSTLHPDDLKQHLDSRQFKLYQLIWRRFLASQMTAAVFETTKVDFDLPGGRYVFRATGSRVLFDGYHVLYHEAHEPEEGKTLEDLPPIPPLAQGDVVTVKQITPNQHFTEPPPRFSEASLVKELERLGIGRPSTYAAIISTLKNRWYATAKDRRFQPTPQGEIVWQVLKRCFPDVFEVGFTAQME